MLLTLLYFILNREFVSMPQITTVKCHKWIAEPCET
jgi:hypothetical protein